MTLRFHADQRLTVQYPDGNRHGTWAIDRGEDPLHLDLNLEDRGVIETIVAFPDADTMHYMDVGTGGRPSQWGIGRLTFRRVTKP